jgi:hypothetical protein
MKDDDLDLDTVTLTIDDTIDDLILSDYSSTGLSSTIDTITLDPSLYSSIGSISLPSMNTIPNGGYNISTGGSTSFTSTSTIYGYGSSPSVNIDTDGIKMDSTADIKIGERSLKAFMEKMEERLSILVPDPAKLEKFAALKKAYENYKLMERLCQEDENIEK